MGKTTQLDWVPNECGIAMKACFLMVSSLTLGDHRFFGIMCVTQLDWAFKFQRCELGAGA